MNEGKKNDRLTSPYGTIAQMIFEKKKIVMNMKTNQVVIVLCSARDNSNYKWLSLVKSIERDEDGNIFAIHSYVDCVFDPENDENEIEFDCYSDNIGSAEIAGEQDILYFKEKLRDDGSQKALEYLVIIDKTDKESVKNDRKDDKLRWDLLPLNLIEMVVKVFHFGAKKYGENRWQNLPDAYNRYKGAMLRHLVAHEKGEVLDPESGLPHLAHMAWNALAILFVEIIRNK